MKRPTYMILTALLVLLTAGCSDFLERETDSFYDDESTFTSYDRTSRFLVNAYTILPEGLNRISNSMYDSATDDAEEARESSTIQMFNNGSWSERNNPDDQWNRYYNGIHTANKFLENVDKVNLDSYRLDPDNQTEYQNRVKDLRIWKLEARFLRAYFHFELLKRYGPVPIVTTTLSVEGDYSGVQRPTIEQCVKFISDECDAAAAGLDDGPWREVATGLGRATKGAALALKSRVLLYAASPLWLDWRNTEESYLPTNETKWKAAADAAFAVIELGTYSLAGDYGALFQNSFNNSEMILARRYGVSSTFESYSFPVSYAGKGGTNPSLNLLDAYEMRDGTAFSWDIADDAAHPYFWRDPRMEKTFIYNGATWKGTAVETWIGGKDGPYKTNATRTGHYLRKFANQDVNLVTGGGALGHTWPLLRIAEIYLNYAEALNEYSPGHTDIATYVNKVRVRAGLPELPVDLSQDQMRQRIRNERRVELAFEEHRAWDVRRWKIASSTLGADLRGMEVVKPQAFATGHAPGDAIPAGEIPSGWYYYDGDEFNGLALDNAYEGQYGADTPVGNAAYGQIDHQMLQTYRKSQVTMASATSGERVCRITATREGNPPSSTSPAVNTRPGWWSGALSSRDTDRYGYPKRYYPLFSRIEVRAKVPYVYGIWIGLWCRHYLGASTAELDMQEFFVRSFESSGKRYASQALHLWNNDTGATTTNINGNARHTEINFDPMAAFHTYGVQVEEDPTDQDHAIVSYLIDGVVTNTIKTRDYGSKYNKFVTQARADNRMMSAWDFCVTGGIGGKDSFGIGYPEDRDPNLRTITCDIDWIRVFTRTDTTPEPPVKPEPPTEDVIYTPVVVEHRVFDKKMYWYPVPEGEMLKMPDWVQNPGWK